MEKIILGLPKGSLNNVNRGNTYQVLTEAGYDITGYKPGNESNEIIFNNDEEIKAFLTRPQSAPVELNREILDIAIIGEDWVKEESVNLDKQLIQKVGDLDYGQTKLIVAVPNEAPYNSLTEFFEMNENREVPILCFTEYPNLTKQFFIENEGYKKIYGDKEPLVQVRGIQTGENNEVQIINSDGATEVYIAKGADLIVDNTQTGNSLKKAGLKIIDTILESSAGLYAGPQCVGQKLEKAQIIYDQLFGAIKARQYFDVKFNIANFRIEDTTEFLLNNGYCSDEPTVTKGENFSQINVLIHKSKFPEMLKEIKSLGASSIIRSNVKQYVK